MADAAIVSVVRRYLGALPSIGIHPRCGVLFGSFARGDAGEWSDIDLVVVAPEFDAPLSLSLLQDLWRARRKADIRIEPIPCGEREWEREDESWRPIIEIARSEGIVVAA